MTVLSRRTWSDLKTEHISRLGRTSDTNYAPRAERFIESAYYELALTYHHFELEDENTSVSTSTSAAYVSLPTDTYIVFGVWTQDPGTSDDRKPLAYRNLKQILHAGDPERSAEPKAYSRSGQRLYFDTMPDQVYPLKIFRYIRPTAPDFSSGSPTLDRLWDEVILDLSVARGLSASWEPEAAALAQQRVMEFIERSAQPLLKQHPIHDLAASHGVPHGGAQG